MKIRSREINIFSMSALDLFASALGAFMLLTIAALPFFPNTGDSPELVAELEATMGQELDAANEALEQMSLELEAANDALEQAQIELALCQSEAQNIPEIILTDVQDELESCQAQLAQTFAMVVINWPTEDDVDLHIIDPSGNEYYYAARNFPGSDAALAEDNTNGPGNEIWLSPSATEGDYEVYINMFTKRDSNNAVVTGSIIYRDGRIFLPDTTLTSSGEKILAATFRVDAQGNIILL
jgi:hypothetical protein